MVDKLNQSTFVNVLAIPRGTEAIIPHIDIQAHTILTIFSYLGMKNDKFFSITSTKLQIFQNNF